MRSAALLLLVASASAEKCHMGTSNVDWIGDADLQAAAAQKGRTPVTPPHVKVNLDLPPEERWNEALADKKGAAKMFQEYVDSMLPDWAVKLLEDVLKPVVKYRGFGDEYSREMEGIAKALDTEVGQIVMINLIYQLESLGVNCSNWNDTGSTGLCKNKTEADVVYPFKSKNGGGVTGPPMTCTSVVAEDPSGKIVHSRNFDWNLPNVLRPLIWEVEFQRGGKHLYTGTSVVGFVGVQNAMKPGKDGFALTMDARCQGGHLLNNLAEMLLHGGQTPTQHARHVMETATSYDDAVNKFATGDLIDPMYFIVSGASRGMGAVIARERKDAKDIWRLNDTEQNGWFRLQTNYDRWTQPPKADDRRTPGDNNMEALGRAGVSVPGVYGVMMKWPTFNYHTDHTCMFVVADGVYNTTVWMGDAPSTGPPDTA
eukprot:TRINITY_DN8189_c0_g1_i1.p1 TRINITY_DN8189_c0_g1~~TRINITY_DN8189_c0_g1_i1.p1  ORF type:complete len:427 (+),score=166.66 TRINITY_DN8189_c0_g1_i1:339-1619(+)